MAQTAAQRVLAIPELLSLIVQQVKRPDDVSTYRLYRTSLVNRAFYHASIGPLHSSVFFIPETKPYSSRSGWSERKRRSFLDIIVQQPALARQVVTFHCSYDRSTQTKLYLQDIVLLTNLCRNLTCLTIFTDQLVAIEDLGKAVGNQIRELQVEWAQEYSYAFEDIDIDSDTNVTFRMQVLQRMQAFILLHKLSLVDWVWDHLVPVLQVIGLDLQELTIKMTYSSNMGNLRVGADECSDLFLDVPNLRSLSISIPMLDSMSTLFPPGLQHLKLYETQYCFVDSIIGQLADVLYLPRLRSLPNIRFGYSDDRYLLPPSAAGIYSLHYHFKGENLYPGTGQASNDEENLQNNLQSVPTMQEFKARIEAALIGMAGRKDWLPDAQQVAAFRSIAKYWDGDSEVWNWQQCEVDFMND